MEATVYNQSGKETGKIKLPEAVFGVKWSNDVVHEVVRLMNSNSRDPIAHTKTRGEVSGIGKEPELKETEEAFRTLMYLVPNVPSEDTPSGPDESGNVVLRQWGEKIEKK
jgi:seryl-tRNA synthetase